MSKVMIHCVHMMISRRVRRPSHSALYALYPLIVQMIQSAALDLASPSICYTINTSPMDVEFHPLSPKPELCPRVIQTVLLRHKERVYPPVSPAHKTKTAPSGPSLLLVNVLSRWEVLRIVHYEPYDLAIARHRSWCQFRSGPRDFKMPSPNPRGRRYSSFRSKGRFLLL